MKTLSALLLVSTMAVGTQLSAASLNIVTDTPQVLPDDVLTVTIQGIEFANATGGGDFTITFDGAALQFVSATVGPLFDTFIIQDAASQPAVLGSPSPLRLDVFRQGAGNVGTGGLLFDAATLVFNVLPGLGSGTSLILGSSLVGWFDPALESYDVTYGSLTVAAVPAPGALWLLATGVGALAWRRKLKAAV